MVDVGGVPTLKTFFQLLDYPKEECAPGRDWAVVRSFIGKEFHVALNALGQKLPNPDLKAVEHRIFYYEQNGKEYLTLAKRAKDKRRAIRGA